VILEPGRTCWRVERARRAAVLVDAAEYYAAVRTAIVAARESIVILGWDVHSRTRLVAEAQPADGLPAELGALLRAVLARREGLRVSIATWDFSPVYLFEREWLTGLRLAQPWHPRLRLVMDAGHPVGASHHQKVVVIDDAIAFAGGTDLTIRRWDTPEHRPGDERRRSPEGDLYHPHHEVQVLLDGSAARALGDLAAARWARATGEDLPRATAAAADPWPDSVAADFEDVDVGIARTQPAYRDIAEVREVEALHLASFAAARRSIYIENQYLTSRRLADGLAARLAAAEGPEVVLVLPRETGGWLEQRTMDAIRGPLLSRLRAADRHGRLRVYYPEASAVSGAAVMVHAKVAIVDDAFLRIGSSNLSNRSLGLDTECDLAIESAEARVRERIVAVRDRLLAEHLGVPLETVSAALAGSRGLIEGIERLRGGDRSLRELTYLPAASLDGEDPAVEVIDPCAPIEPGKIAAGFIPCEADDDGGSRRRAIIAGLLIALLLGLAALWQWTPLGRRFDVESISRWMSVFANTPAAPVAVVGVFVAGGLIVLPVVALIVATALIFDPLTALACSFTGVLASAAATYGLGRLVGRDLVRRVLGARVDGLCGKIAARGLITVAVIRMLPVAPFGIVNVVAGACRVGVRDFFLGTMLGMAPGMLALTLFAGQVRTLIRRPGPLTIAVLVAIVALVLVARAVVRRMVVRRRAAEPAPSAGGEEAAEAVSPHAEAA
jgi:phospholipase D1/2